MKTACVFACLVALVCGAVTNRPCEDAPIDCAAKDAEMDICKDPIDSVAYCPRYCGRCQGPTPALMCHDFDKLCGTLVNSNYCQKEIAKQLCAKSCGHCENPTTTPLPTTTTTTTTITTTTPEPTTTPIRYTEIPDPACQDVDPNCLTLLQVHYCGEETIVAKLCRRSCNMCPTIMVPITNKPEGPTDEPECQDNDKTCSDPGTAASCDSNDLLHLLCPLTCGVCGVETPTPQDTTLPGLPNLGPTSVSTAEPTVTTPTTPKPALTCRVCVDPFCEREIESIRQCPEDAPFCSSQIINSADGTHGVTKRCATKDECDIRYTGMAAGNETLCDNFDPNKIVQEEFVCHYCCTSDQCNRHAKPDDDSLHIPSNPSTPSD